MKKFNKYIPFINLLVLATYHILEYYGIISQREVFIFYQFADFGILMTIYCLNLIVTCKLCNLTKLSFIAFIAIAVLNQVWAFFCWDSVHKTFLFLDVYDWIFYPVVGIALLFDGYAIFKYIRSNREKKRKMFNG